MAGCRSNKGIISRAEKGRKVGWRFDLSVAFDAAACKVLLLMKIRAGEHCFTVVLGKNARHIVTECVGASVAYLYAEKRRWILHGHFIAEGMCLKHACVIWKDRDKLGNVRKVIEARCVE